MEVDPLETEENEWKKERIRVLDEWCEVRFCCFQRLLWIQKMGFSERIFLSENFSRNFFFIFSKNFFLIWNFFLFFQKNFFLSEIFLNFSENNFLKIFFIFPREIFFIWKFFWKFYLIFPKKFFFIYLKIVFSKKTIVKFF